MGKIFRVWIILPFILITIYLAIFNRFTAQKILDGYIPKFLPKNLHIQAKFTKFSLLYGISLKDIRIEESEEALFTAEKISLLWNLPALFIGQVSIRELSLENPRIYVVKKDGITNWEKALGSSEKKEEPPPDSSDQPLESLNTFIPISIYYKIKINSLSFSFQDYDSNIFLNTNQWDFYSYLNTKYFSKLPLSLQGIDVVKSFGFLLNPNHPIELEYNTNNFSIKDNLFITLILEKEEESKGGGFLSKAKIGAENLQVNLRKKQSQLLSTILGWDFMYFPQKEYLALNGLYWDYQGENWLFGQGKMEKDNFGRLNYQFKLEPKDWNLKNLNTILSTLPFTQFRLGGKFSIQEVSVMGTDSNVSYTIDLAGSGIQYNPNYGKSFKLNSISLQLGGEIDPTNSALPTKEVPLPILKRLNIKNIMIDYDGAVAKLRGDYDKSIQLWIELPGIPLENFIKDLYGKLQGEVNLQGENLANLGIDLNLSLQNLRFRLDRSLSGYSNHNLKSNLLLKFKGPLELNQIQLDTLKLETRNQRGRNALNLETKLSFSLLPEKILNLEKCQIQANTTNWIPIVPLAIRNPILSLENISKTIIIHLNGKANLSETIYSFQLFTKLPDIGLNDIKGGFEIAKYNNGWNLKNLYLSSFDGVFNLESNGKLIESKDSISPIPGFNPDIKISLNLKSDHPKQLNPNINYRGNLRLNSKLQSSHLTGDLVMENIRMFLQRGTCPGSDCKLFLIENLNADIPISHNFNKSIEYSLLDGDKSRFIKTYGRLPRDNFTIQQIIGSHPSLENTAFAYVKGAGSYPGLSAKVGYQENYFFMDGLKLSLLDGVVYGKDILFHVADGSPKNMEFMGSIQVRDIDLKQLMSPATRKIVDDGKIKLDLNVSLRDFTEPIANLNLYFSIFQIGRDFGKSVLNILSTKGALMNYITDSYAVDKVDIELSKGLVYAEVKFKPSLLSMIVSIEDSRITQSRMPLMNFVKRAEDEISTYK